MDLPCAFESIYGEEIDTELDSALCVPDRGAFVEDNGASLLQLGNNRTRAVTSGLDYLDALVDDDLGVGGIVWWYKSRQQCDIDAKGVFGHVSTPPNFISQILGCRLGESCEDTQASRVRNSSGQLSISNVLHATLYDRNLDAQAARQLGVERHLRVMTGRLVLITILYPGSHDVIVLLLRRSRGEDVMN